MAKRHNADVAASKERQLAPLREHAFRPGQSGNPNGRPKGARNKLTTEFFEDFYAAWQEHGAEALKKVAESSPRDFVRAAAMLMPKEFEIKTPLDDMNDAELGDLIAAVQALVAAAGGVTLPPAEGERPTSEPKQFIEIRALPKAS
jgi:Family of unknown function (DUF5681)